MAVRRQSGSLRGGNDKRIRDFQANLLSLISHELRTPLTGISSALDLLEVAGEGELSRDELIARAKLNVRRLNQALSELLDLAALESGTFIPRFRELDLAKLFQGRDRFAGMSVERRIGVTVPVLADPQKILRASELLLQLLSTRAKTDHPIQLLISGPCIRFRFRLRPELEATWQSEVEEGTHARSFRGTRQPHGAFLVRREEGLGSELMIVSEIIQRHKGELKVRQAGDEVEVDMRLPELKTRESVREILLSRASEAALSLRSVVLALVSVPVGEEVEKFRSRVRSKLFRSSDSVYSLPEESQLAILLEDCKKEDAPRLLERIRAALNCPMPFGLASCPDEGTDPDILLDLAERRLERAPG